MYQNLEDSSDLLNQYQCLCLIVKTDSQSTFIFNPSRENLILALQTMCNWEGESILDSEHKAAYSSFLFSQLSVRKGDVPNYGSPVLIVSIQFCNYYI